jgi:hypothetical protein
MWSKAAFSALAVATTLAAPDGAFAAGSGEQPESRITVRVDDKAGVQGATLKIAEARAAQVFAMSGVKVDWIDGAEANRLKLVEPYTILIMVEAPAKLKAAMERIGPDVMGQGDAFIGRAYIYYDRILQLRPIPPRDVITTLGDVIAHELGHLMLPPGHSIVGIMRPSINMMSRRVETFTKEEAAQLRSVLRERAMASNTELPNGEPNVNTN